MAKKKERNLFDSLPGYENVVIHKGSAVYPIPQGHSIGNSIGTPEKTDPFKKTDKQVILGNIPSKSNCYRIITFKSKDPNKHSHASLAKTPELRKYEEAFYLQCGMYRNRNILGFFELEVDVYYPTGRSDLDNSLKVLLDCLQKINAFPNDNRCTRIVANKFIDKTNPRIEFSLKETMNSD